MAISGHRLLLRLSILLGLLVISSKARPGRPFHPCQTLIFFSTSYPLDPNRNLSPQNPFSTFSGRRSITFFFTRVRDIGPKPTVVPSFHAIFADRTNFEEENRPLPLSLYSSVVGASFRDRTKDILRIVGSLLFGAGCGVLTAATLYLVWSLFSPNRFEFRDYSGDNFVGDDGDDVSPKKIGYVAIPATDSPVTAAPAKEVV
ncbi:hypothetical protein U1Q18_011429 [Sarracenia purpurea var. burkii]